jgi:hypothetical protein
MGCPLERSEHRTSSDIAIRREEWGFEALLMGHSLATSNTTGRLSKIGKKRIRQMASRNNSFFAYKRMARPGLLTRITADRQNRRDEAVDRPTDQSPPSRFAAKSRSILRQSPPIHQQTVPTQSYLHGTLSNHAARPCRSCQSKSQETPES